MEIRQLKTLVSILDHGGFALAGEVLGLTQSAISLQIKALEKEFGEELFDRRKRPPRPTARAVSLARKSREILRMCNDLNTSSDDQLSGTLQLGAVPSVQRILLPKAVTLFRDENPDVFINVHTGLSDELMRGVYRGVIDAAVVSEPTKLPMGLSWFPFASETLVVVSHERSLGTTAKDLLEANPYIQFRRTSRAGEIITGELKALGIKTKTVLETDNIDSIWQIVSCGMGVAVMPQHIADNEIQKTGLLSRVESNRADSQESLIPNGVKVQALSKNPVKLITGLVRRTADPKAHLIDVLLQALQH